MPSLIKIRKGPRPASVIRAGYEEVKSENSSWQSLEEKMEKWRNEENEEN